MLETLTFLVIGLIALAVFAASQRRFQRIAIPVKKEQRNKQRQLR